MNRKELIQRYLDAETTLSEEQELSASFAAEPPADAQEKAVFRLLNEVEPVHVDELPAAEDDFDRITGKSRIRALRTWGLSMTGIAAALVAGVLLTSRPQTPPSLPEQSTDVTRLLEQIALFSSIDPTEADSYEFKPVGEGFVMTAHFPDGNTASYILTPMDGGKTFNLISMNQ